MPDRKVTLREYAELAGWVFAVLVAWIGVLVLAELVMRRMG